ncbi:hypothetical protein J3459_013785 [Metarhizium acridum]|nr:hypothetical protein J3459_013785 [Metarhizium acridum]
MTSLCFSVAPSRQKKTGLWSLWVFDRLRRARRDRRPALGTAQVEEEPYNNIYQSILGTASTPLHSRHTRPGQANSLLALIVWQCLMAVMLVELGVRWAHWSLNFRDISYTFWYKYSFNNV